ncbi:cellulase family glycosylhydrolase [bacterium]|nr:cellulase family glycosylhydrolase [bacterium]
MKRNRLFYFLVLSACLVGAVSQIHAATIPSRGVTIGDWLNTTEDYHAQTTRYTLSEFQNIASLGIDHVRILVNFNVYSCAPPDYPVSPITLKILDNAVQMASDAGLKIVIANTGPAVTNESAATVRDQLTLIWKQVAAHFKDAAESLLYYEILTAPGETIATARWRTVAEDIVAGIREEDTNHFIVVGPSGAYSIDSLAVLTPLSDTKIMYAFSMFDPPVFARQGTTYRGVAYNTVVVPFPYDAAAMPAMDAADAGTAAETAFGQYATQGTQDWVRSRIQTAFSFTGGPLYCAALGAAAGDQWNGTKSWHIPAVYRGAWFETVRQFMEQIGIAWCLSSFRGNYGFYNDYDTNPYGHLQFSNFAYDINDTLALALGLTPPVKGDYMPVTEQEGFTIFDEEATEAARVGFWLGDGEPNFFVEDNPASGKYCMGILYPGQWCAVDFFFPLFRDLSDLAAADYVLDFFLRCDNPDGHIQARFEDTNDDMEELPWRMNYHVDNSVVPFDGDWQSVTIPLLNMEDQGAWDPDDRTWYNGGQGMPDWTRVQRLQFVSETAAQPESEIYLDRIRIVSPTAVEERVEAAPAAFALSSNYPNPFNSSTVMEFSLPSRERVDIQVVNAAGRVIRTLAASVYEAGVHRVAWDGTDESGQSVPSGVYMTRLRSGSEMRTVKMALIR